MDGKSAAEKSYRRKRSAVFNMLSFPVEDDILRYNPLARIRRKSVRTVEQIGPGVVASPRQVRELLTAVTYVGQRSRDRGRHLVAFFATIYYSAARPGEALALKESDCNSQIPDG